MEFTSYAALLTGASPSVLRKSLVAQHSQTIKVREWHLLEPTEDEAEHLDPEDAVPLAPGNPGRGYIPDGTQIKVSADRLELIRYTFGPKKVLVYHSWASVQKMGAADRVKDVFLTGEVSSLFQLLCATLTPSKGHSAWGQFNLVGRVRPCDGYISVSKEYVSLAHQVRFTPTEALY